MLYLPFWYILPLTIMFIILFIITIIYMTRNCNRKIEVKCGPCNMTIESGSSGDKIPEENNKKNKIKLEPKPFIDLTKLRIDK